MYFHPWLESHVSLADMFLKTVMCCIIFFVGSDIAGAFVLLHEAETKLKRIVHDKFEAAIQNGDRNSVERCCFLITSSACCDLNVFGLKDV